MSEKDEELLTEIKAAAPEMDESQKGYIRGYVACAVANKKKGAGCKQDQ